MSSFRGSTRAETKPRITAWSFSRLKTWTQCPAKLKYSAIDGLKEPESSPMLEGKRVHKLAEDYLLGNIKQVPEELILFGEDYKALRQVGSGLMVERKFAFREDLTECEYFSKEAWLRAQFDGAVLNDDGSMWVYDLKTGKPRQDDKDQLSLFAFIAMLVFPQVQEVRCELWYSATGRMDPMDYTRAHFESLKNQWLHKAEPMLADEEFLPTPNGLCGFCHYRKSNGGPCRFS